MADSNTTNPFVLPGLGQSSDASGNPLLASMDMMRQAWAGFAGSGGLSQMMPMGPSLNVEELDRRIAELRSVESWLRMNLSMLDSTIQGMEVQRATINTLKSFVGKMSAMDPAAAAAALTGGASPMDAAAPFSEAAQSASKAWWNLLQEQFNNLATATAASMPGAQPAEASAQKSAQAKPASKPARKKAAPRKTAPSSSDQP
jgi:hypothetical protein